MFVFLLILNWNKWQPVRCRPFICAHVNLRTTYVLSMFQDTPPTYEPEKKKQNFHSLVTFGPSDWRRLPVCKGVNLTTKLQRLTWEVDKDYTYQMRDGIRGLQRGRISNMWLIYFFFFKAGQHYPFVVLKRKKNRNSYKRRSLFLGNNKNDLIR